jgi:class 3 adenylate cyclase
MLVARLRRKIEPDPKSPRFVVTTPGIGYKFAPRPQPIEAPAPISTGLRSDQGQIHSLPAERRQLTVLSGRIVGLAALSSRLDPEDLRQVIGAVRNACVGVLARFQGLLAEFQGDTLLGYFGYPRAHGDDAERAVRGGLQLVRAINDVKVPFARLQLRLGIATGPAVIGNLDGAATECVAVGQPVHWALHLQSVAEPGAVVIASDTRNLVRDSFACDEIGSIALDGSIAPVRAWRVLGERIPSGQFELRCTGMSSSGDRQEEIEPWSRRRSRAMSWRQSSRGSRGNWVASISNKQGRS